MEVAGKFVVRRATESDLDAAASVWHESAVAMDGQPDVPSPEALRQRIATELRSGWELHVALVEQRIVGLLAIKLAEATLDQIFVLPEEQGKGVGTSLMEVAKSAMPEGFQLRMAASNRQARRFYEKAGLKWLREDVHPWTGVPVHFYSWNAATGEEVDAPRGFEPR